MKSFLKIMTKVVEIKNKEGKKDEVVMIYPTYNITGKDLMKKGGKFYAILDDETGYWVMNESRMYDIIDKKLYLKLDEIGKEDGYGNVRDEKGRKIIVSTMDDSSTKNYLEFSNWFSKLPQNHNYKQLDSSITFQGDNVTPDMYVTKTLPYKMEKGSIDAYEKLMDTLYSPEDKRKIEWAIGSVFTGDSKKNEKFVVLYGDPGTGKSTVLDMIKDLFEGYYGIFVAAELANKQSTFATSAFKDNPLVAIQDDGSLKKIDSPIINEIISHKEVFINEKNKSQYPIRANAILFMATNELVDLHDTKLGITRRLLDVYPTGNKLPVREYRKCVSDLKYELGAIAYHCKKVYEELGKEYYIDYEPREMIRKTNDLRNFISDNFDLFLENEVVSRDLAYKWYKAYCEESGITYILKRIDFGEQLREYYENFYEIKWVDGKTKRNIFEGFKKKKFDYTSEEYNGDVVEVTKSKVKEIIFDEWLDFKKQKSIFDLVYENCPAQYAEEVDGVLKPITSWALCTSVLKNIDTSKVHYVKPPENLICIDFDIKDEEGKKNALKNKIAASKWPETYGEYSKSGEGIHLYYIYNGDVSKLKSIYDKDIEVKTFRGKAALRRKLTKCNDKEIAIISSGLPTKGDKVLNEYAVKNDKHLRALIGKALRKEIEPGATKTCMDYILKVTDDAYKAGIHYDVNDMVPDIMAFANNSTHNASYCLNLITKMHLNSDEPSVDAGFNGSDKPIIFFDVEVFENLFIVCWKYEGEDKQVVKMINPTPSEIEELSHNRIVGFNNRNYDNHILYARIMGYNNYQLYELSQRIISDEGRNGKFYEATKMSYTDIYDYASKKQSLKKWEIELGIHHQELGIPWDKPVPKDKWELVAEYCANDVVATEAVWNATQADFMAREILADLSGLTVNDMTNQHTTKIIVGNDKHPQDKFVYTDLSTIFPGYEYNPMGIDKSKYNEGTKIVKGKSLYLGEDPGEGGYVYATVGIHRNVGLLDVASMHPHSAIKLNIFGDEYTGIFRDIVDARVAIKREDYDTAGRLFGGKLKPYLNDKSKAKALAQALKIAINSVYGLTSATFDNKLRDPRNKDNIVAKYGALFMINLKHEVQKRGYTVVHIKTDSIKIADMDDKIKKFCMKYAEDYGYEFEHEATYEKICLVNESTYIAKDKADGHWTATGTQFQIPYVFKTLFSHEPIKFEDMCETKSVTTSLYLDFNEGLKEDEHNYQFIGKVGQFTPVKEGFGGGVLLREKEGKYSAVTGTKKKDKSGVYRWYESEALRKIVNYETVIDTSYFNTLANEAIETINKFGDFNEFVSDDSFMSIPEGAEGEYDFMNPPQVA